MWFWWMMYIISQNQRRACTRGWVFTGFLRHEKKKKKIKSNLNAHFKSNKNSNNDPRINGLKNLIHPNSVKWTYSFTHQIKNGGRSSLSLTPLRRCALPPSIRFAGPMAASIPLDPDNEQQQRAPASDGPLVRLAQRPELQHNPEPIGEEAVWSGMGQRNLVLLHAGCSPGVPDETFCGGDSEAWLARGGELSRAGEQGWVPVQCVGESRFHLVLWGCWDQETRLLGFLHRYVNSNSVYTHSNMGLFESSLNDLWSRRTRIKTKPNQTWVACLYVGLGFIIFSI